MFPFGMSITCFIIITVIIITFSMLGKNYNNNTNKLDIKRKEIMM